MNTPLKHVVPFKKTLKRTLDFAVDRWARARGFSFPSKYPWQWKVEMLRSRYEKDTTDLFKNIVKPGMAIVDVGAHIGYFTRLFAERVGPEGRVFAFEPDPYNFSLLQSNTAGYPNVTIINAAVSDAAGTIDFYEIEDSTGCHTTLPTDAPAKKLSVRAVKLDEFVREKNVSVDIIKMDIEGGEPKALAGMDTILTGGRPLSMVLELNPEALGRGGTTPEGVIASLRQKGFAAYGILRGGMKSAPVTDIAGLQMYEGKTDYANVLFERLSAQS